MVLPLLLGALGSGAASAGLLGSGLLASPLVAGAIGSGLGSAAQSGSLEEGIKTGMLSFLGGQLAGRFVGGGAEAVANATKTLPAGLASLPASQATQLVGGVAQPAMAGVPAPATGQGGIGALRGAFSQGQEFMRTAPGMGMAAGAMLAPALGPLSFGGGGGGDDSRANIPEMRPAPRSPQMPPASYRPGIDAEALYGVSAVQPFSQLQRGAPTVRTFAEGGITTLQGEAPQPNDKQIVERAIMAVRGEDPNPEVAVGAFLARFGERALRALVSEVRRGNIGRDQRGQVRGPGDGMEDLVPATIEGQQDVLLSDGEFVVPADVVSGLGNGSTEAGAKELERMNTRVREMRTGGRVQPPPMDPQRALPV